MFNVNNKDTTGDFFVNFEHVQHHVLVFLLLTQNMYLLAEFLQKVVFSTVFYPIRISLQ